MPSDPNNHPRTYQRIMSVPKTILAILWEAGQAGAKSFFPHPYYHTFCHHRSIQGVHTSLYQLRKRGLVRKKDNQTFCLTPKGEKEAFWSSLDAKMLLHKMPKQKWDGYWRMIFFDVPEKNRRHRDYLRSVLKTLGFRELQRSIWVSPSKIPDFLKELLWEERIKPFTRFITVKEIDYDKDLRKIFGLK